MSDFWIYLMMTAMLFAALALIKFFSWLTLIQERGGAKQIARETIDRYVVVKHSQEATSNYVEPSEQTSRQTEQTDQQTARPPAVSRKMPRLELDRTRAAVLEELLTHGWTITDLRRENILRGDNDTISKEVAEIRKRLGLADPERTIKVRDTNGEREIARN